MDSFLSFACLPPLWACGHNDGWLSSKETLCLAGTPAGAQRFRLRQQLRSASGRCEDNASLSLPFVVFPPYKARAFLRCRGCSSWSATAAACVRCSYSRRAESEGVLKSCKKETPGCPKNTSNYCHGERHFQGSAPGTLPAVRCWAPLCWPELDSERAARVVGCKVLCVEAGAFDEFDHQRVDNHLLRHDRRCRGPAEWLRCIGLLPPA